MKKLLFSLFVGLVLLAGCGKDDPKPNNPENLSNGDGKWILTARIYVVGSDSEDEYALDPACIKDNIFYFSNASIYQILAGPSKCDPTEPDILETGTWSLSSDGKQLIFQLTGNVTSTFDVLTLNKTTLKVKSELVDGVTNSTTSTYTKQ